MFCFQTTFLPFCGRRNINAQRRNTTYSAISRYTASLRNPQKSISEEVQHVGHELTTRNGRAGSNDSSGLPISSTPVTNGDWVKSNSIGNDKSKSNTDLCSAFLSRKPSYDTEISNKTPLQKPRSVVYPTTQSSGKTQVPADKGFIVFTRGICRIFQKQRLQSVSEFQRQTSTGSANTISNSSLQDMDESEFTSLDLVTYMEQVNDNIT